jgi:hypothetical protein
MNLATYAGGYHRLYRNDEEEISVVEAESRGLNIRTPQDMANYLRHWWPGTLDFRAEAQRRGYAVPVNDFNQLLVAIRQRNHLQNVMWFGHATSGGEMQFGNNGVSFGITQIAGLQNPDVSSHFTPNGRIIIYGCNAGRNTDFAQSLANALRVPVCAFATGIRWQIEWSGNSPRRITYRGVLNGILPTNYTCYSPR